MKSIAGNVGNAIGLCPQELVIWEGLTINKQLVFIAQMHDVPYAFAQKRVIRLLDAMGLSNKKDKLAVTLSGGMKRRLNILLEMMHDPLISILDETPAGLDPQSRILAREYIKSLARQKTGIITTHDIEEANKMIEQIAIIELEKKYPSCKGKLEMVDVASPITFVRYTDTWQGAAFSWLNTSNTGFIRVSKTLPGLNNLYMLGHWTRPPGGLPGALVSGRWAIQVLCKKDKQQFANGHEGRV